VTARPGWTTNVWPRRWPRSPGCHGGPAGALRALPAQRAGGGLCRRRAAAGQLLRLKDVTVELVDLLVDELRSHRDIWSPRKKAAQDDYARRKTWLAEHGMEVEGV